MMLSIHEILFDMKPGNERDQCILAAISENYQVDRAAVLALEEHEGQWSGRMTASFGDWQHSGEALRFSGEGFDRIVELHEMAEGALTFESVRKPEAFTETAWRSLWAEGVGSPTRALLSMTLGEDKQKLIWLQQTGSTREWSSRDRDLIEEIAVLLAKAARRGI